MFELILAVIVGTIVGLGPALILLAELTNSVKPTLDKLLQNPD